MSNSTENIGVLTEVGDLGLGFTPLNDNDKKVLEEKKNEKEDR